MGSLVIESKHGQDVLIRRIGKDGTQKEISVHSQEGLVEFQGRDVIIPNQLDKSLVQVGGDLFNGDTIVISHTEDGP